MINITHLCLRLCFSGALVLFSSIALLAQRQKGTEKAPEGPPPEPYVIERLTTGLIPYQVGPLSPDGKRLLVLTKKDREGPLLISLDLSTRELKPLVDLPGGVYQPRWSPRGDAVVMSGSDGRPFPGLYLYTFDGAKIERLTTAEMAEREPAFFGSSDRIVFTSESPRNAAAVFGEKHVDVLSLGHGSAKRLLGEDVIAIHPEPIPGSDHLLVVEVVPDSGRHRLVETTAKGDVVREFESGEVSYIQSIALSADGSMAVLEAQHRVQSPVSVYLASLSDGTVTEIGGGGDRSFHPALSPDGKRIVCSEESRGVIHLYLQTLDSDDRQQLTMLGSANWSAVWIGSNRVVFASDRQGEPDVYMVRLDQPSPPLEKKPEKLE